MALDRKEESLRILKNTLQSINICNYCVNECPYVKRMSAATEIINNRSLETEDIIVNELGENPFKGEYGRGIIKYTPVLYCNSYEGSLEGDIWDFNGDEVK